MSEDRTKVQWSELPEEYACPSCDRSARGYTVRSRGIRGNPEDIRLSMKSSLFPSEVLEWADGKGCNVVESSTVNTPECSSRVHGPHRHGPMYLLCDSCHNGPSLPDHQSKVYFYWRISTRHGEVWAHNRQHLVAIRDYIQLERRPQGFIKLPGWMLASKNRNEMIKLIDRVLANGPTKI